MLIRDKDKKAIVDIAKSSIRHPSKVLAYGSRVDGTAHETSDLDLVIVSDLNENVDIGEFMDFKQKLKESNIPIVVQVLDWNRIPKSFHENILSNFIELVHIK